MNQQPDTNSLQDHSADDANLQSSSRTSRSPENTAQVARQQADHIYHTNPPNQLQQQSTSQQTPYQQTHQPIFDWQNYHSAWQQYYQQYYERYYAHQIHTQRQQFERERSEQTPQLAWQTVTGNDDVSQEPKTRFQQLREDLLRTVRKRTRAFRRSNHFVPILSAIAVGAIFLFLQYNRVFAAQVESYISPGSTVDASDSVIVDPANNANVGADPKLIIPKINVDIPVVYGETSVDNNVLQKALEKGAVHYNLPGANSVPGQAGNTVLLGHSSNDVFDPGVYKFVFVLLEKLQNGDLFYMNYQSKRYVYKVTDKKVIKPTDWRILQETKEKPQVVLVTCTPVGTAQSRLLVYGEQISPDPAAATQQPENKEDSNPNTIPGNSPTFFERLQDLF